MSADQLVPNAGDRNAEKILHPDPFSARVKLFSALLILCAVIAYFPAINAGFIWDDAPLLTANPQMQSEHGLKEIWLGKNTCDYTPLTLTVFWLERSLWGDTSTGYHLVNILLHALAGILLWRTLLALRAPGSWLAALLFVIHPVNVASVAWIAELKNTLSAAFFFAAIFAFLCSGKNRNTRHYLLAITLFTLAGLSKGAVVTMPIVLCACLLWMKKKIVWNDVARLVPFALIALLISFLTIHYQSRAVDYGLISSDLLFRIARAGTVVWHYLVGLVFPTNLSPMLPQWQPDLVSPFVYLPGILLIAVLGVFVWTRKTWGRPFLFVSGYYLWMLLPVLGFVWMALQQQTPAADWWQYLAAPGIFAGIAGGVVMVSRSASKNARLGLSVVVAVILTLLLVQTWRRSAIYQSMETYCRAILAENPHAWIAQNNLGVVLEQRGELEPAISCYRQALRDNPRYLEAHNNLGNVLAAAGNWPEAETEFLSALHLSPANAAVLGNLADNYFRQGKIREAFATDGAAVKADRYNPQRYVAFGRKLAANQQFEQATVCFRNALLLNPGDLSIQLNLVQALVAAGHGEDAFALGQQALRTAQESGNQQIVQAVAAILNQSRPPAR